MTKLLKYIYKYIKMSLYIIDGQQQIVIDFNL